MKKRAKIVLVVFCLYVAAVGAIYWQLQAASNTRWPLQIARDITDVPGIHTRFAGFAASDVQYIYVHLYRGDRYIVAGRTSGESLEAIAKGNQYIFLDKVTWDEVPSFVEEVFQEIPASRVDDWSNQNWFLHGGLVGDGQILLAMNPATGQFWATMYFPRGPKRHPTDSVETP